MLTEVIETQLPLELALKDYVLSKAEAYSPTANYSPADIAAMNEMELAKLGAENDRYILVCFVNVISSQYLVVAKTGHASLAAVLLDKQTSEVLWSNKSDKSDTLDWMFDMGLFSFRSSTRRPTSLTRRFASCSNHFRKHADYRTQSSSTGRTHVATQFLTSQSIGLRLHSHFDNGLFGSENQEHGPGLA